MGQSNQHCPTHSTIEMSRVRLDLPEKSVFTAQIPVRVTDLNYGGHVGNDSLLSILHEARVQFLKHFGFTEHNIGGRGIIMSDAVVMYKAEIFHGAMLTVEIGIMDTHEHGTDITYKVMNEEKEVARAKTGIVFFDYEHRKIASTPSEFKALFVAGSQSQSR
jgi:acyl-CoA thioester hydrolase